MYTLYLDETGTNTLKHIDDKKPHFLISSVIVHNNEKENLRIKANQIKFKYWGKYKKVCFHANEMEKYRGIYSIFNDNGGRIPKIPIQDFYEDMCNFLKESSIKIGISCINKKKYISDDKNIQNALSKMDKNKKNNWAKLVSGIERKILFDSAYDMFVMFLSYLLSRKDGDGQVVIESSSKGQDMVYFDAYTKLLCSGCSELNLTASEVRQRFTSISFVTKNNEDIETQIADLVAHFFGVKCRDIDSISKIEDVSVNRKFINVLDNLTFDYKYGPKNSPKNKNSFSKRN